jgi:hypothetical protein
VSPCHSVDGLILIFSTGKRDRYGDAAHGCDKAGRVEAGDGRVPSRDVALSPSLIRCINTNACLPPSTSPRGVDDGMKYAKNCTPGMLSPEII